MATSKKYASGELPYSNWLLAFLFLLLLLLCLPFALSAQQTREWQGSKDSNWHNPANWSGNKVPQAGDPVLILSAATHLPLVQGEAWCGTLQLETGTLVTLGSTGTIHFAPAEEQHSPEGTLPLADTWEIYPNPAAGNIRLRGKPQEGSRYQIIGTDGRAHAVSIQETTPTSISFDLSALAPGLYYLQVTEADQAYTSIPFIRK